MPYILAITPSTVFAGPPFFTDDPEPVESHNWEINYAATRSWSDDEYSMGLPSIDINYGFSTNLQLHIQPRYTFGKLDANLVSGIDNSEVGVKYRFINYQQQNVNWMVGIYPMLQIPTGSAKLGSESGKAQLFLPIWAQLNTKKWLVYGGSGYRFNNTSNGKNSVFGGITALYSLSEALQLGGEIFHETSSTTGESAINGFNLGGIFALNNKLGLLFSAGKSFSSTNSDEYSAFLGIQTNIYGK